MAKAQKNKKNYDIRQIDKKLLHKMLYQMVMIRRFEEACGKAYGLKKIGGFCHLYIGQEAVAVGAISALDMKLDAVFTGYRDHGHAIACGSDINALMAELYGKVTGISRGKGGSMHFFDKKNHMFGGNGIVGAHIPLAAGYAMKCAYKNEPGVAVCMFGDGAIHQGSFHETLNMSKVWNLPVIYICENNQYGMGTFFKRVSSVDDFSVMGSSYGIPGEQVDGMNVLNVYEAMKRAVERARKERIPTFLEIKTYRYKGHSMSDPGLYRTKEELESYKELDPILILKGEMTANGLLEESEYEAMDQECKDLVAKSVTFAETSDEPAYETIFEDILAE
jgi:pyruvate dehydrogenase E1 component alpha subunit